MHVKQCLISCKGGCCESGVNVHVQKIYKTIQTWDNLPQLQSLQCKHKSHAR